MAVATKRLDDALLVRGREAREDVVILDGGAQVGVAHRLDFRAEQDFLRGNADLAADLTRDEIVVAGEHFHPHAVGLQCGDGGGRGVLRRIEKGEVAAQDEVGLVGLRVCGAAVHIFVGHGEHAEAVGAQFLVLLDEIADEDRLHRENLAAELEV